MLTDPVALIGGPAAVPLETPISDSAWLEAPLWVVSTPLRRGSAGEQVGVLRLVLHLNKLEVFKNENRTLFGLSGVIAGPAVVLLALAISRVVAAPVKHWDIGNSQ